MSAYHTFAFEQDGLAYRASVYADDDGRAPWENEDGHGPVRGWDHKDTKKPGEMVLAKDSSKCLFYDVAEATRTAKRGGWGLGAEELAKLAEELKRTPTRGEIIARAVQNDFVHLRRFVDGDWHYCGVAVQMLDDDGTAIGGEYDHALWGIESDAGEYLIETAHELAREIKAPEPTPDAALSKLRPYVTGDDVGLSPAELVAMIADRIAQDKG